MSLPTRADVVVIGGGVIGLSAAYHLAASGVRDVVLVEKDELGSGSTCKAAGGVRAQFSDAVNIELGLRSLRTFETFREEFGQEIDLHQVGYLFLLDRPEHVALFEKSVSLQNELGVPSRMIDVAEAKRLSPLIDTEGVLAAAYSPDRRPLHPGVGGARVRRRGTPGRRPAAPRDARSRASSTTDGPSAPCCTDARHHPHRHRGLRGRRLVGRRSGRWSASTCRSTPVRREILVTEPIPGLDPRTPFTIDFATSFYFHAEGPGLLMGMSDPDADAGSSCRRRWRTRRATSARVSASPAAGPGSTRTTPDHNALIGEADEVDRFLYATGFSGHGFLMGPAVGEVVRDLYHGRQAGRGRQRTRRTPVPRQRGPARAQHRLGQRSPR